MRHPFLRTLAGSAATPTDPNFENVTLLLHGDGTNGGQNNTFVDGSTNNFTITRNGNTTQGTFSPYGDNWSNYFDTTNTSLVATGTTSTGNFPTSTDFTIEFWWRSKLVNSGTGIVVAKTQFASTSADSWWMEVNGSYKVAFVGHSGTSTFTPVTSTTSVMDGVWHHCAVSRAGTTYRVFVDGALEQTTTNSTTMNQGSRNVTFAGITTVGGLNYAATGYISNLRIVVGTCLYTAAFTPSTAPLTSVTNTVLLTCQSNRFKDNGPNAYTISTQQGTPSVQRFSPFSPTAAYAAGTIGGSGYFDGTGDTLVATTTTTYAQANQDFTVEAWVYRTALGNMMVCGWTGSNSDYWYIQDASISYAFANTYTVGASYSTPVGAWTHIALTRQSGTCRIFVNGNLLSTVTNTNRFGHTSNIRISGYYNSATLFTGYVSDFRFIVGAAQYTANFTPPTAPLTAITNTSLLLNFTNAAILDNAMMSDLETVGNAQIDTTTKKYGTGSLKFDGTGDGLKLPFTPEFVFGSGNFTVECWVYVNSLSAARDVFNLNARATNGYASVRVSITTAGAVYLLCASADQTWINTSTTANSTIATGNWYHIAAVRNGSSFNLYVDGVSKLNYTSSATLHNYSSISFIGAENSSGSPITVMDGYIDDFRVTKGVARYTAAFTAPTAAFPDL